MVPDQLAGQVGASFTDHEVAMFGRDSVATDTYEGQDFEDPTTFNHNLPDYTKRSDVFLGSRNRGPKQRLKVLDAAVLRAADIMYDLGKLRLNYFLLL
jgi:hypothetical protein